MVRQVPAGRVITYGTIARLLGDPRKARVVELRFFGGLTMDEIAEVLEISRATVERDWNFARTWLYAAIEGERGNE